MTAVGFIKDIKMNFIEAIQACKEGKKVRYSFWPFDMYLYLKGEEFIEKEKNAIERNFEMNERYIYNEWELYEEEAEEIEAIQTENLRFSQALDLLVTGKAKEISMWNLGHNSPYVFLGTTEISHPFSEDSTISEYLLIHTILDEIKYWQPNQDEMLSENWRVIE